MAINISEKYPGRSNPPSIDYPQGSIKNQTAPGARDGTPLDEAWANDKEGFFQKALAYRGVTPSGTPDTATNSQYFDAVFSNPSESLRGMPMVATSTEARSLTDRTKMLTPGGLDDAFTGSRQNMAVNGFQRFPGGFIRQWGYTTVPATGILNVTFPIPFPNNCLGALTSDTEVSPASLHYGGVANQSKTSIQLTYARNGAASGAGGVNWEAWGN